MVVKKSNIIGIALMLSLALAPNVLAADNNLVQLDLKKSANNAVDLTFFTTNPYQDNIVVRKKSDNKYVVLMPKVLTSGYTSPDLNSVRDLVSHIDVKSINESGNAYTKVTLITTKPLEIKTRSQKAAPVSHEQQEYKTLIAQAKNNAAKSNTSPAATKPAPAVNKQEQSAKQELKQTEVKPKNIQETKAKTSETKQNKINQISDKIQSQTEEIKKTITVKKTEQKQDELSKNVPDIIPSAEKPQNITLPEQPKVNTKPVQSISLLSRIKTKTLIKLKEVKHRMPVSIPTAIAFILIPLIGIVSIIKLIKSSLIKSNVLKESFINNLEEKPVMLNSLKYNNIVNDEELTWQQKYQKYLDATAQPVSRGEKKGNYTFIKQPAPIEEKRESLEQMFTEMAEIQDNSIMPEIVEIHNEEDKIKEELHNTVKFKSFAQNSIMTDELGMSRRNKAKSRFKKYDIPKAKKVQKNIDLGDSLLHTNPRKLENAALNVSDIRGKGIEVDPNDYVMSSVEEFFSILDKEKQQKSLEETVKVTNPVASSLSQIKPSIKMKKEMPSAASQSTTTNPIAKLRSETKDSYLNGLIVKSGYNIDENKGFYVVSLDGTSALIGRIKDEVFVLKKFDKTVDKPVQVRHDNANVYMVKAADFKSLVEVNEDKMGVLIEL